MTKFIRGPNPIWFFNNLVGQPVDDTYFAFFLTNTLPYLPQPVYQDPNGLVPWSNPIEFQANAGLPNNIFVNETLVYRIEIRKGNTQNDPLIYLIENYSANGQFDETFDELLTSENLITNPQFVDILFTNNLTITTAGTYTIAPGWDLVLSGVGSTTVTQGTNPGNSNIEGSPSYYIQFTNSGWDSVQLIQTFINNGSIFANGAVALAFTAACTGNSHTVTVSYVPNGTANSQNIFQGTVATGNLTPYYGAININPSLNANSDGNAKVQLIFTLPNTDTISISNIQFVGQSDNLSAGFILPNGTSQGDVPAYKELSYERMVDHEFNVYRDSILILPKNSILTGWNFGLNPFQFTFSGAPTVGSTTPLYVTDQTIFKAEQASSLKVSRDTTPYGSIIVQAIAATTQKQFAFIQYIDPSTMFGYWGERMSSLVRAFIGANGSAPIKIKMRLIYNANLPSSFSGTYPIDHYDANGDPVFAAGWTAITPQNDPSYTVTTPDNSLASIVGFPYSFDNFVLPTQTAATQTLGIVFYIVGSLDATIEQQFFINSISLVPNRFAIEASPQTWDESLRRCEFYYEKSYDYDVLPSTVSSVNELIRYQIMSFNGAGPVWNFAPGPFEIQFRTVKRANPTMNFYTPDTGVSGSVTSLIFDAGATGASGHNVLTSFWNLNANGTKLVSYRQNTSSTLITYGSANQIVSGHITFHYTADSRLGL